MSNDEWTGNNTDTETVTINPWRERGKNVIRLVGLIAVALTAWNFFAWAVGGMPVLAFWPAMLARVAPAEMSTLVQQGVAAVVGAILVWFV